MTERTANRPLLGLCSVLALLLAAAPVFAQQGDDREPPAVSKAHFTGDFGASFDSIDDVDRQSFTGGSTFYAPVADVFGIAVGGDLGFGAADGDFGEVVGVHGAGFWRDPRSGYIGAALTFDHVSDFQRVNVSAIGGAYLNDWDLMSAAGYDGGDGPGVGLFSFETGYYLTSNLRLGGELAFGTDDTISGGGLIHWQPAPDSPVTLSAHVGGGELDNTGFYAVSLGLTVTFSDRKSLRDQLRTDRLLIFD